MMSDGSMAKLKKLLRKNTPERDPSSNGMKDIHGRVTERICIYRGNGKLSVIDVYSVHTQCLDQNGDFGITTCANICV